MSNKLNSAINRRQLCRWVGWFFVANTFLYFLTGLNYLFYMPNFSHIPLITTQGVIIGWVFMLTGLVGQFAIFAFAGCILAFLLILLFPRRWFAFIVGCLIAAS